MAQRPVGIQLPRIFSFRMSADDADRLCAVAGAHGYEPSEWARLVLSREAGVEYDRRPVRLRVLHADLLRAYLAELNRQGNNLNQIAKAFNEGRGPAHDDLLASIGAIRAQNSTIMDRVLDALGAGDRP